jgi:hypothetical protein
VKAKRLNSAIASGKSSGLTWARSSAYPGYSFDGQCDESEAISSPSMGNPSTTTQYIQVSPHGQPDQDFNTSEGLNQATSQDHMSTPPRMATETSMGQVANSDYEFASFDYALTNGHKESIFDAGWWNPGSLLDGWDYHGADMATSSVIP